MASLILSGLRCIIKTALEPLELYSKDAEELLIGTCAIESDFGKYVRQLGNGCARGIYQMEPLTYNWLTEDYLGRRDDILEKIMLSCNMREFPSIDAIEQNHRLATIMARLKYYTIPAKLPEASNLIGMAMYWKEHYNTFKGKGTVQKFINNYNKYIQD